MLNVLQNTATRYRKPAQCTYTIARGLGIIYTFWYSHYVVMDMVRERKDVNVVGLGLGFETKSFPIKSQFGKTGFEFYSKELPCRSQIAPGGGIRD